MGEEKKQALSKEEIKNTMKKPSNWRELESSLDIGWVYIKWWDGFRPCKILSYKNKRLVCETENGGVLEVNSLESIRPAAPRYRAL